MSVRVTKKSNRSTLVAELLKIEAVLFLRTHPYRSRSVVVVGESSGCAGKPGRISAIIVTTTTPATTATTIQAM